MQLTRPVAGTVIAGLLGVAPLTLAAPSQAASGQAATSRAAISHKTYAVASPSETRLLPRWDASVRAFADDSFDVEVDVDSDLGYAPPGGTTALLARPAGSSTWVEVAESTTASGYFTDVQPTVTTTYKAVYSGFTASDGDTYARVETATFTVEVGRRITFPVAGFVITGKVTPDYGRRKIVITVSKQQNRGFKAFRTIRTTATGRYKITLPRRGGTRYWSFAVTGDAAHLANGFVWKTFVG